MNSKDLNSTINFIRNALCATHVVSCAQNNLSVSIQTRMDWNTPYIEVCFDNSVSKCVL